MNKIICINLGFIVPKNKLFEVQPIFDEHANWMKEFYSESNEGRKYLISAYLTRASELKDPTNPAKGETNNLLFTLNEKFTSIKSLKRHNEQVQKNEYFLKFSQIKKKYATFRSANGKILHSIR
jgi:hypothetical protein